MCKSNQHFMFYGTLGLNPAMKLQIISDNLSFDIYMCVYIHVHIYIHTHTHQKIRFDTKRIYIYYKHALF